MLSYTNLQFAFEGDYIRVGYYLNFLHTSIKTDAAQIYLGLRIWHKKQSSLGCGWVRLRFDLGWNYFLGGWGVSLHFSCAYCGFGQFPSLTDFFLLVLGWLGFRWDLGWVHIFRGMYLFKFNIAYRYIEYSVAMLMKLGNQSQSQSKDKGW